MSISLTGVLPALSLEVFSRVSAPRAISLAREAGYSGVGLPAHRRDFSPSVLGVSGARDLAVHLDKNMLSVSWLSAGPKGRFALSGTLGEDIERMMGIIRLAGTLRASAVTSCVAPLGDSGGDAAGNFREALGVLANEADGAGTLLALSAARGDEALVEDLVVQLGDAPVGVLIDPGADLFSGRDPVERAVSALRIAAVRASDCGGEEADLAPGEGRVAWRDFLAAIATCGYHGWATVEFSPRGNDHARAAAAFKSLGGA